MWFSLLILSHVLHVCSLACSEVAYGRGSTEPMRGELPTIETRAAWDGKDAKKVCCAPLPPTCATCTLYTLYVYEYSLLRLLYSTVPTDARAQVEEKVEEIDLSDVQLDDDDTYKVPI